MGQRRSNWETAAADQQAGISWPFSATAQDPAARPHRLPFQAHCHILEESGPHSRIKLTPGQGKILRVLLENEGRVVSTEQLMTKVWHYDAEGDVSVANTSAKCKGRRITPRERPTMVTAPRKSAAIGSLLAN